MFSSSKQHCEKREEFLAVVIVSVVSGIIEEEVARKKTTERLRSTNSKHKSLAIKMK